jgi:hypothetical protein
VVSKVSVNLPGVEKQAGEDHRVWVKFRSEPGFCVSIGYLRTETVMLHKSEYSKVLPAVSSFCIATVIWRKPEVKQALNS